MGARVSSKYVSLARSEPMLKLHIVIDKAIVKEAVAQLGSTGMLQFFDLNEHLAASKRPYIKELQHCHNLERDISTLRKFVEDDDLKVPKTEGYYQQIVESYTIEELPEILTDSISEINQLNSHYKELHEQEATVREHLALLKYGLALVSAIFLEDDDESDEENGGIDEFDEFPYHDDGTPRVEAVDRKHSGIPLLDIDVVSDVVSDSKDSAMQARTTPRNPIRSFRHITGTVSLYLRDSFERLLFRVTRGNVISRFAEIPHELTDPRSGNTTRKFAFCLLYHGMKTHEKITQICGVTSAHVYKIPETFIDRANLKHELDKEAYDLVQVLHQSKKTLDTALGQVAQQILSWERMVHREKCIYHTLSMLDEDLSQHGCIAEAWCPVRGKESVEHALEIAQEQNSSDAHSVVTVVTHEKQTPPTYFVTNTFTGAFQALVNAYGTPRYREFNPALFTVITFPFLFGVMFGDVGHGMGMTLFALLLLWKHSKWINKSEILDMVINGRYIILLMGIFSTYTGLIYNDCFSLPLHLFSSSWCGTVTNPEYRGYPYPFGLDWMWRNSTQELAFTNSMKMKMSILIGVSQMMLGLFLSMLNALHYRSKIDLICVVLPKVLFLLSTFGYLCVLIVLKWSVDWTGKLAPSIIQAMLQMFLKFGNVDPLSQLFRNQHHVERLLILLALLTIPWMLFAKPFFKLTWRRNLGRQFMKLSHDIPLDELHSRDDGILTYQGVSHSSEISDEEASDSHEIDIHFPAEHVHESEEQFGEVITHQFIETLEFVLGTVSNTASYLRLWALSLAHAELSAVFWEYCVVYPLKTGSGVIIIIGFIVWLCITIGILMIMESISVFLHALRLHWVEFQNKFFYADGYPFQPFTFKMSDQ